MPLFLLQHADCLFFVWSSNAAMLSPDCVFFFFCSILTDCLFFLWSNNAVARLCLFFFCSMLTDCPFFILWSSNAGGRLSFQSRSRGGRDFKTKGTGTPRKKGKTNWRRVMAPVAWCRCGRRMRLCCRNERFSGLWR